MAEQGEVTVGEMADLAESKRGEWIHVGGGMMMRWEATFILDGPLDGVFEPGAPIRWKTVDVLGD